MRNIAIIPARSGSKGLKDKNILELKGRPLIDYTIRAALDSGCFDEVMVSTDSQLYADISVKCGASVPFLRSAETSSDTAGSWDVVREVLRNYEALGKTFDTFMLLQPTSPLRTHQDIRNAYALFNEKQANSVIAMCQVKDSPAAAYQIPESLSVVEVINNNPYKNTRRQDIPKFYKTNGAIFLSRVDFFLETGNIFLEKSYCSIMDEFSSVDVDTLLDFEIVKSIMELKEAGKL